MIYSIGARIKKFREKRKLTQSQFAQLIGISSGRLSNWEKGLNRPDADMIKIICNVLEVSSDELLNIKIKETEMQDENNSSIHDTVLEIMEDAPEEFVINGNLSKYKAKLILGNIEILLRKNKKDIKKVLQELNINKNFITKLNKSGKVETEDILKLSKYFKVPVEYIVDNKVQDYLRMGCSPENENYLIILSEDGTKRKYLLNSDKRKRIETILKACFPEIFDTYED